MFFKFMNIKKYANKTVFWFGRFVSPFYVTFVNWLIKAGCVVFFIVLLIEACNGHLLIEYTCSQLHLPSFLPQILPFCHEKLYDLCLYCGIGTGWAIGVLFFTPLILPHITEPLKISYLIALLTFGSTVKITFRPDKVILTKWFIYRRTFARSGITFESVADPRGVVVEKPPQEPGAKPKTNFYAQGRIVILRKNTRVVKIANVYDFRASKLGHRADGLLSALHTLLTTPQAYDSARPDLGVLNTAQIGQI